MEAKIKEVPHRGTEIGNAMTESDKVNAEKDRIKAEGMKLSGIVFAFVYRPHVGFANYSILRLRLKNGKVEEVEEVSDPHAAFEARAHMETKQAYHLEKMRTSYPAGFRHV